ncbi:MAG: ECF-type sigma factor [Lysobacterales bacterium]
MKPITDLLMRWRGGDKAAEAELIEAVYPALREMSRAQLRRNGGATMQATELAHEAYERLLAQQQVDWQNREHFMAIAATVVRRVLIDYLRERSAQKRGSGQASIPLHDLLDSDHPSSGDHVDWLMLDQALTEFARVEPDTARVVELRLFGGMSVEEIASVCGSSTATVGRQWRFARAWIASSLALPAPQ